MEQSRECVVQYIHTRVKNEEIRVTHRIVVTTTSDCVQETSGNARH